MASEPIGASAQSADACASALATEGIGSVAVAPPASELFARSFEVARRALDRLESGQMLAPGSDSANAASRPCSSVPT